MDHVSDTSLINLRNAVNRVLVVREVGDTLSAEDQAKFSDEANCGLISAALAAGLMPAPELSQELVLA